MPYPRANILSANVRSNTGEGELDSGSLQAGRDAGFGGVLWRSGLWLSDEELRQQGGRAQRCRAAALRPILEVDLARFPLDHPAVASHPDAFAIRRAGPHDAPVDPRKPMPAKGEALARLRSAEVGDALGETLAQRLDALAGSGIGGFRFARAERIAAPVLQALIDRLRGRYSDLMFLAGPFGSDAPAPPELGAAGLDFLVSSFSRWDGKASWLLEELDSLPGAAPLLGEIGGDEPLVSDSKAVRMRIDAAAALASGLIVPISLLRDPQMREVAARAVAQGPAAARFGGALHPVSSAASPVTVILRGGAADLRVADRALLLLINTGSEEAPLPAADTLSQAAAIFTDWQPLSSESTGESTGGSDASTPLAPGETRLLAATRGRPIISKSERPADGGSAKAVAGAARLVIEEIEPRVDGGAFAVKRVVGDVVTVRATVFTDGHEQLGAELRWRALDEQDWSRARMVPLANDRWQAEFPLQRLGRHEFVVEGWLDRFGGFRRDFAKKWDAGVAQPVDHAEGRALIASAAERTEGDLARRLRDWAGRLEQLEGEESAALLLDDGLAAAMIEADDRPHCTASPPQTVDAERLQARFSSWYELFPRSMTPIPGSGEKARHGTFADVIEHLPRVRDMGFDTLYFPPIHPIGRINRKGPNNTLTPGPDDPGSPYAIGSEAGGHDAIHPELGSFEDFDRLVAAAHGHGLEIALDFAIQAAPDHPWLKEHPGWFAWRPDGSMKYAENPPKKYQDIVNVDFYGPDAIPGLWEALRDVVLLWVGLGVKTFRVDNPHTKPLPFWEWMIGEIRARHPDVIFLSEAFTRPTMMYRLAKIGFSQSYTYFTWRDRKHELIEYITELTTTAPKEFYRPHFFVNTPDINPFFLQNSGRPGFRIRAVLAATLSGLFGVYSGFELCDGTPLGPGKEEYLDSEKFEIRPRDWNAPGNIIADIALLNRLRKSHPALQTHLNTRFYPAHDDNIIWYGKPSPGGSEAPGEMIMMMVNLDPHNAHACSFEVPLWEFGLPDNGSIAVEDLAQSHRFDWHGKFQHIRIAPDEPYRIWRLFRTEG